MAVRFTPRDVRVFILVGSGALRHFQIKPAASPSNGSLRQNVQFLQNMTRQQILDLYFVDARFKLIELAAFMDRVERSDGDEDFRMQAFREALAELSKGNTDRAKRVLMSFSDPTTTPIPAATTKAASGAFKR
jgi:hypothetical protein